LNTYHLFLKLRFVYGFFYNNNGMVYCLTGGSFKNGYKSRQFL
jgi:hypothetical protein